MKILVVDDSEFTRRVMVNTLRDLGVFHIDEAVNGLEGVSMLDKTVYQLATVDLVMPKSSGIDVIKYIKKISPDTKIVVCSSVNTKETVMELVKMGIDDFVLKPFKEDKLRAVLQTVLKTIKDGTK